MFLSWSRLGPGPDLGCALAIWSSSWCRMYPISGPGAGPGPSLSPTPCCREMMQTFWWTVAKQAPPFSAASRGKSWKVRQSPLLVFLDHSLIYCLIGHHTMLVAVPQRRCGHRHQHRKREVLNKEGRSSLHHGRSWFVTSDQLADSPSRRVLAILGAVDADQDHTPCQLFTQLDELTIGSGDSPEWKEAAR